MFESFEIKSNIRGSYNVQFIDELSAQLSKESERSIFVIDSKLAELYSTELAHALNARHVIIECSEHNKTVDYSLKVIRGLINQNARKDNVLIAIGGGITQDIVAFISSILFRGVNWKFYPSTLLAQCDSCIGSKSSINFDKFKNMLGTFNPPEEIFIYNAFLGSLPQSEIKSGIGEMLHYYFTEGIDLAEEIHDQYEELLEDHSKLDYFISNSLRIKKAIIEIDEFDTEIRHIFNYGHTFGHAIEAITNYAISHGQAISIGMDLANFISLKKGMQRREDFERMHRVLDKNIPVFGFDQENIDEYMNALSRDKKNKGNMLGCILSFGPGKVEKMYVEMNNDLISMILNYSQKYSK